MNFKSWIVVAFGLILAACGGGGAGDKLAGIGSGGTGGIASGPITGFGSVIVGGVRFDDTGARVTIDGAANQSLSQLRLGMIVDVVGDIDATAKTGVAREIVARYAVRGPVTSIDPVAKTLVVLGQRVRVDATSLLDGLQSFAEIAVGDLLAVSGLPDATTGAIVATRVERRAQVAEFVAQGTVSDLANGRFHMGTLVVDASTAVNATGSTLASGAEVLVRGTLAPSGILVATRIEAASTTPPAGAFIEYVGYISNFASASNFKVGTYAVDASAAFFEGGTASQLGNGVRVEVEGRLVNGVLKASEVDFLNTGGEQAADLEGSVTDFVSVSSFRVRGQAIDAATATFTNGTPSQLGDGRVVRVVGLVRGGVVIASTVDFRDSMPPPTTRMAIEGVITDFSSWASFRILGFTVATNAATVFTGGTAADLGNGRRIAAEGTVDSGLALLASTVTIFPVEVAQVVTTSGRVAEFVSTASFSVNGQKVAAQPYTQYVNGTAATLKSGVLVTVTGTVAGGVLQATRIEFTIETPTTTEGEVEGYVTNFVSLANFKVNGQVVDATAATYENGKPTSIANGRKVHCTGPIVAGVLKAKKVEFP